jgi:hypothetical protein
VETAVQAKRPNRARRRTIARCRAARIHWLPGRAARRCSDRMRGCDRPAHSAVRVARRTPWDPRAEGGYDRGAAIHRHPEYAQARSKKPAGRHMAMNDEHRASAPTWWLLSSSGRQPPPWADAVRVASLAPSMAQSTRPNWLCARRTPNAQVSKGFSGRPPGNRRLSLGD